MLYFVGSAILAQKSGTQTQEFPNPIQECTKTPHTLVTRDDQTPVIRKPRRKRRRLFILRKMRKEEEHKYYFVLPNDFDDTDTKEARRTQPIRCRTHFVVDELTRARSTRLLLHQGRGFENADIIDAEVKHSRNDRYDRLRATNEGYDSSRRGCTKWRFRCGNSDLHFPERNLKMPLTFLIRIGF